MLRWGILIPLGIVFVILTTSIPVSGAYAKTIRITIENPFDPNGVLFRVVEDIVEIRTSLQEIRGYAPDQTPVGRIGTAFTAYEGADIWIRIALENGYTLEDVKGADFPPPRYEDGTVRLAVLLLLQYSGPHVRLGYATVDLVLLLSTGQGVDEWVIDHVDEAGSYASRFVDSIPSRFEGAVTWSRGTAHELWKAKDNVGGICGLILVPVALVAIIYMPKRDPKE